MNTQNDDDPNPFSEDLQKMLWEAELRKQQFFREALEKHNDYSVEAWLGLYTLDKYQWMEHFKEYDREHERREMRWMSKAHFHLEIILQKKLFDLQCRWRAEQIKLPGIEICYDFVVWEEDVFNCPFLEPVTAADLDLYMQYLQQPGAEPAYKKEDALGSMEGWQEYDLFKEAMEEGNDIPSWYKYHNECCGGNKIFALPNIRGRKEERYHDLTVESREWIAATGERFRNFHVFMASNDEQMLAQALEYEGPLVRRARDLYIWRTGHADQKIFLSDAIRDLLDAGESIPVAAHDSWIGALTEVYRRYQCRKIASLLPEAYEQYRLKLEIGIAFPRSGRGEKPDTLQSVRNIELEHILTGRRLAGESEDLDF